MTVYQDKFTDSWTQIPTEARYRTYIPLLLAPQLGHSFLLTRGKLVRARV